MQIYFLKYVGIYSLIEKIDNGENQSNMGNLPSKLG